MEGKERAKEMGELGGREDQGKEQRRGWERQVGGCRRRWEDTGGEGRQQRPSNIHYHITNHPL